MIHLTIHTSEEEFLEDSKDVGGVVIVVDVEDNEMVGEWHGEHINVPDFNKALGSRYALDCDFPGVDNAAVVVVLLGRGLLILVNLIASFQFSKNYET